MKIKVKDWLDMYYEDKIMLLIDATEKTPVYETDAK